MRYFVPRYAEVIVNISHESVDRPFTYRIPETLENEITVGTKVMVPFGKGNTMRKGFVISLPEKTDYEESKIKAIDSLVLKQESNEDILVQLAAWIRKRYGGTMIQALKIVLPVKKKVRPVEKKTISLAVSCNRATAVLEECRKKKQRAKERLLESLIEEEVLDYQLVRRKLNISAATLNSLEKQAVIRISVENYFRNPLVCGKQQEKIHTLNQEQQKIVDDFSGKYGEGNRETCLLHGVTGSGKTEVYIAMMQKVIALKKQVIFLIPEIALTYQTVLRLYHYFGERVSIMNSTLSEGEKFDQFQRAEKGEIDIIVGPRSALFTPFKNLGLIIIDEEHEPSYKSESVPRYHAREVALELAKLTNAAVVLGSATPSVESYYHARKGDYRLYRLEKRATGGELPAVQIADMRRELKEGNRSIFSRQLQEQMANCLNRKEQMMLFLNRRGYAGFVSCRSCGEVLKCPHCDISLSEHRDGSLRCHYCGYTIRKPSRCPSCGSKYILGFRAGTEQVEQEVLKLFPGIRVLRMDKDTTGRKESYEKILTAFKDGKADVLIGTQMIVKGHDFPNVTLMGIIAADLSLAASDYRAGERTFDLLTQAAGRAGRGEKNGQVVIQTYQPEHYANVYAAKQDYEGFYEEEIIYRELAGYPPVCHIMAVMVHSKEEQDARDAAERLAFWGNESEEVQSGRVTLIGPARAGIAKINDYYRFILFMKSKEEKVLLDLKEKMEMLHGETEQKTVSVFWDFDPVNPF